VCQQRMQCNVEELYGLKGLNFCPNPPSRFFLLLVYYII
jgi:hypothetical protein